MVKGIVLSVLAVAVVIFFITKFVKKFKLTKKYITTLFQKVFPKIAFNDESIIIESFEPQQMKTENYINDKYYYQINAKDNSGKQYLFEGCIYDPSADYAEEQFEAEQKKSRPKDESMNSTGAGLATSTHSAGIEMAQGMLRDQAKLEKEGRVIEVRTKKFAIDVEITKKINEYSNIVPKIYFFDEKKNFVLTEFCGLTLLKDVLVNIEDTQKLDLIKTITIQLAHAHNAFKNVSLLVPSRRAMQAEDFRKMLHSGLKQLVKAKLLSEAQINDLLNEYYSTAVWLGDNFERNIRFKSLTPYEMFVNDNNPVIRNWSDYDTSSDMTNLIDLLKDPIVDLSIEQEEEFVKLYRQTRFGDKNYEQIIKQYHLNSCHILTVQLCYMILYIKSKLQSNVDTDVLVNWDQEHFDRLFSNALNTWSLYEESRDYAAKLKEVFDSIA
ncbi:hypothetical protein IMX26_06110 [Clostridium sp. 'deep sea']|uniref:hypothetical protein n=1 Tax=Clostridium sp. 'deep sea' TaxID=2779445 RepID=UPI0018968E13|nr:hypothetical protein [Clostridium sp. 'deep sea']QOR36385.1 hypothetical protein IMX26_06110 [Clostridium sp. 'deep sea']